MRWPLTVISQPFASTGLKKGFAESVEMLRRRSRGRRAVGVALFRVS